MFEVNGTYISANACHCHVVAVGEGGARLALVGGRFIIVLEVKACVALEACSFVALGIPRPGTRHAQVVAVGDRARCQNEGAGHVKCCTQPHDILHVAPIRNIVAILTLQMNHKADIRKHCRSASSVLLSQGTVS